MSDYSLIPPAIMEGLIAHRDRLHPVGGFLTACLENDLRGAISRADEGSARGLFQIVGWLYWEMPSPAWGSREKVRAWLEGEPA